MAANLEEHIARRHQGDWPLDPAEMAALIAQDFGRVAKVMIVGSVTTSPATTRNPLLGLMDLRKELVQALIGPGDLYWGGCEFGTFQSGDLMHFDMGRYPALSTLR